MNDAKASAEVEITPKDQGKPADSGHTFEVSVPGQGLSFVRIFSTVNEQLTRSYERVRWLGFTAISGGLLIIITFAFAVSPVIKLPFVSQLLFTITGLVVVLLSAAILALQNVHAYRLENANREFAIRSLELKHQERQELIKTSDSEAPKNRNSAQPFIAPGG
jgi:hypothetical protein